MYRTLQSWIKILKISYLTGIDWKKWAAVRITCKIDLRDNEPPLYMVQILKTVYSHNTDGNVANGLKNTRKTSNIRRLG